MYSETDPCIKEAVEKISNWIDSAKIKSTADLIQWWQDKYNPNNFTRQKDAFDKTLLPVCFALFPLVLSEFKGQLYSSIDVNFEYTAIMQTLGNHLRAYGGPYMPDEADPGKVYKH